MSNSRRARAIAISTRPYRTGLHARGLYCSTARAMLPAARAPSVAVRVAAVEAELRRLYGDGVPWPACAAYSYLAGDPFPFGVVADADAGRGVADVGRECTGVDSH